jgi:surface antigen
VAAVTVAVAGSWLLAPGFASAAGGANGKPSVVSGRLCQGFIGCDNGAFSSHDYAAGYYQSWWNMDAGDECTNYVAFVEATVYGVPTPDYLLGNAADWPAAAAAHGVVVDDVPAVGAVAVWDPYSPGIGPLGHVGVVEAVGPHNSYIVVSQQHLLADADGYEWTRLNPRQPGSEWESYPNVFIHFRGDVPFVTSLDEFVKSVASPDLAAVAPAVRGLAAAAPVIGPQMVSPTVSSVEGIVAAAQQKIDQAAGVAKSVLATPTLSFQVAWPVGVWSLALDATEALTFHAPLHLPMQLDAAVRAPVTQRTARAQ